MMVRSTVVVLKKWGYVKYSFAIIFLLSLFTNTKAQTVEEIIQKVKAKLEKIWK